MTVRRSHLEFRAGVADLVDVGQRASVVRSPRLSQAKLLDLLKLHLPVKHTRSHDLQAVACRHGVSPHSKVRLCSTKGFIHVFMCSHGLNESEAARQTSTSKVNNQRTFKLNGSQVKRTHSTIITLHRTEGSLFCRDPITN